jgi:ubiquinol-cytochrome c reductase subunit 7
MRVASQQSILHKDLPKDQWVKESDVSSTVLKGEMLTFYKDVRYLTPIINDIVKEEAERAHWDSIIVERKK